MSAPVTQIVMVGPRGVGKTSLLAAMYGELKEELRELKEINCSLITDAGPTQRAINERLKELKGVAAGSGVKIQTGEGIDGTILEQRFKFHLRVGGGDETEAALEFIDLPGGWYTAEGSYERADQTLAGSRVSFLAIDATALMESPVRANQNLGKYHEEINAPTYIKDSYERVRFEGPHTVILTLIRAETYIKNGKVPALIKKAKEAYSELAEVLDKKDVPFLGCHVETVGSLYFNAFTEENGVVSSHFMRDVKKGYSPSRCSIPLRIAVGRAFGDALNKASEDVNKNDTFLNNLKSLLNISNDLSRAWDNLSILLDAYSHIASQISDDDYFEIKPRII